MPKKENAQAEDSFEKLKRINTESRELATQKEAENLEARKEALEGTNIATEDKIEEVKEIKNQRQNPDSSHRSFEMWHDNSSQTSGNGSGSSSY